MTETDTDTDTTNPMERAARAVGLRVRDGKLLGYGGNKMAFEVPMPNPEDAIGFMLNSLVKHLEYRPNTGGDLSAIAAEFVNSIRSFKPARSVDAGQAVYQDVVTEAVLNRLTDRNGNPLSDEIRDGLKVADTWLVQKQNDAGETVLALASKGDTGAFKMQSAIDSVAESQRASAFDRVVAAAIEAGRQNPVEPKGEPGKKGRSARKLDLGFSL